MEHFVNYPQFLMNENNTNDLVDHPQHYNQGKFEVIEEMEMLFGREAVKVFCRLNAYKYYRRAPFKGNMQQDYEKGDWYLNYLKELEEKDYYGETPY